MVDEDSHSTNSECLGWRSHSTILLAHYNFCFNWGQSYLATLVTQQNCTKMLRNPTFVVQFAHIRPKSFCFFEQLLSNFLRNSGKRFEKSRATCTRILFKGRGSNCVTHRVLTKLVCRHLRRGLLQPPTSDIFRWAVSGGWRDKPTKLMNLFSYNINYSILVSLLIRQNAF